MSTRIPFAVGEWYHCYSRGVERRRTFEVPADYSRFLQLLYLSNSSEKLHRSNLSAPSMEHIMSIPRPNTLVSIGAYCLMPNHFHLLLRENSEGGITSFMRKLGTAYTMYFNIRHRRVGNLFIKPFRSRHVADDRYFQRALQYIHFNPADLYEPKWKSGIIKNVQQLDNKLVHYEYSSFGDYTGVSRATRPLLDAEAFSIANQPDPRLMLEDATLYDKERSRQGDTLP